MFRYASIDKSFAGVLFRYILRSIQHSCAHVTFYVSHCWLLHHFDNAFFGFPRPIALDFCIISYQLSSLVGGLNIDITSKYCCT